MWNAKSIRARYLGMDSRKRLWNAIYVAWAMGIGLSGNGAHVVIGLDTQWDGFVILVLDTLHSRTKRNR